MYGHASKQEFLFQLAKAGLDDIIPNGNLEQLLKKLHPLIERITFRIDLDHFCIDLEQTKKYWSRKFIQFITQDYNFLKYSSVSEIVNHLEISLVTLDHAFKEDFLISPKQLQIYLRNYFAAYLLSTTNWTAKKIAGRCEFANEHEFYKCFKNKTGITPKQFRQTKLWQDFSALYMENIGQKPQKTNKPAKFITRNDTNNKK